MSEGIAIGGVSVGLGDTRNIDSQVSIPKVENDDLRSLPTSFYSSDKGSVEFAMPTVNEFAGLGDLNISSEISLNINSSLNLDGLGYEEAEEMFAFQAVGGATSAGFEGQGASYRSDIVPSVESVQQMAERFAVL